MGRLTRVEGAITASLSAIARRARGSMAALGTFALDATKKPQSFQEGPKRLLDNLTA